MGELLGMDSEGQCSLIDMDVSTRPIRHPTMDSEMADGNFLMTFIQTRIANGAGTTRPPFPAYDSQGKEVQDVGPLSP